MAPSRARRKTGSKGEPVESRDKQLLLRIFETMVMTRAVEDRMVSMYRSGDLLGSLYTGHWHEAISVGPRPRFARMTSSHRSTVTSVPTCGAGMDPAQVMASFMGKATSPTRGRDGTLHYGRLDLNIYNLPSHIPDNYPVALGFAFAFQYRDARRCVAGLLRRRVDLGGQLP